MMLVSSVPVYVSAVTVVAGGLDRYPELDFDFFGLRKSSGEVKALVRRLTLCRNSRLLGQ